MPPTRLLVVRVYDLGALYSLRVGRRSSREVTESKCPPICHVLMQYLTLCIYLDISIYHDIQADYVFTNVSLMRPDSRSQDYAADSPAACDSCATDRQRVM